MEMLNTIVFSAIFTYCLLDHLFEFILLYYSISSNYTYDCSDKCNISSWKLMCVEVQNMNKVRWNRMRVRKRLFLNSYFLYLHAVQLLAISNIFLESSGYSWLINYNILAICFGFFIFIMLNWCSFNHNEQQCLTGLEYVSVPHVESAAWKFCLHESGSFVYTKINNNTTPFCNCDWTIFLSVRQSLISIVATIYKTKRQPS